MKSNSPSGFSIYEWVNLFLAPRLGYFAHLDLKQKWNVLKISAN